MSVWHFKPLHMRSQTVTSTVESSTMRSQFVTAPIATNDHSSRSVMSGFWVKPLTSHYVISSNTQCPSASLFKGFQ